MVLLSDEAAAEPIELADGVVLNLVAEASQRGTAIWLPVRGDLVSVFLELPRRPGFSLVSVGETVDGLQRSYYLARAAHNGQYFVGYCAFHLTGARIRVHSRDLVATKYEVLVGEPADYLWKPVRYDTGIGDAVPVVGGSSIRHGTSEMERSFIVRYRSQEEFSYGSLSSVNEFETLNIQPYPKIGFEDVDGYEVLVISKPTDTLPSLAHLKQDDRVQVTIGRFKTDNHWTHVKKGDRFSTAVNFTPPLAAIPRIVMGFDYLDMGRDDSALRLRLYPQNITKDNFICNAESWNETYLYNCGTNWAAIEEPGWQCGVLKTKHGGNMAKNRVSFNPSFSSPPMVFVCFSGLDMVGRYYYRVHATNIDHTGFNVFISRPADAKIGVVSVTWIAIPGEDVLKRKNAWIGNFRTDALSPVKGKEGEWEGHETFGFEFERTPKIFLGVDHLVFKNGENIRLDVSASGVSKSGMDWRIKKWDGSVLHSAGASFLALDCA